MSEKSSLERRDAFNDSAVALAGQFHAEFKFEPRFRSYLSRKSSKRLKDAYEDYLKARKAYYGLAYYGSV